MRALFFCFLSVSMTTTIHTATVDFGQRYIAAWTAFYPSKALDQGIHAAIFDYEDLSPEKIATWLDFNKEILKVVSDLNAPAVQVRHIDARLLRAQIRSEIHKWEHQKPHINSPSLYTGLISKAMEDILEADFLDAAEKAQLICRRLTAVKALCISAIQSLETGPESELQRGLKQLTRTMTFYSETLPQLTRDWKMSSYCSDYTKIYQSTAGKIEALRKHLKTKIAPVATITNPILGKQEYGRRLRNYFDNELSPEALGQMALEEIEEVRDLIYEVSKSYLLERYPHQVIPKDRLAVIKAAFADMEEDAPTSGQDYLAFWQDLSVKAITFIEEHQIATLPKFQTLEIKPAPESAGPAARIGWVESAPPFAPNPLTTLYLPSIPDTLPAQEQKEFWSSFNKPFNRMIVIHELFPGHYMQIKISRESPHSVRLYFPYRLYFEGWATFTERVLLDAGWEKENKLTLLAHLRKRLENANRAYTSVQVHCQNWNQEKVMQFSTETSLLAPQFAKSLWGRLMRSPMQMTSYFLGGKQFTDLLASEKERLGKEFVLIDFMDTILRAGPIPIDEFTNLLK